MLDDEQYIIEKTTTSILGLSNIIGSLLVLGLPMGMYSRRFIAWVGETSMVSSMKEFLSSGSITVSLENKD